MEAGAVMYWDGGGRAWVIFMPVLWIVLTGLAVWAVVRLTHSPSGSAAGRGEGRDGDGRRESPEDVLDRRYASGEIDTDMYTEARERLAAHRPRRW